MSALSERMRQHAKANLDMGNTRYSEYINFVGWADEVAMLEAQIPQEPSPRDKLMQAYEKAGTANALYVKKHYGSSNG